MAEYKYGSYMSTSGGSNFIRPYIYYEIDTSDPTNVNCVWTAGCNVKSNWTTNAKITLKTSATDASDRSVTVDNKGWGGGHHAMIKNVDYNWSRGTSARTVSITAKMSTNVDSSTVTLSISVPARPTVTVTYNTHGGSSVSSTNLYYGIAGSVSSTRPTKANYTFMGWATSDGGDVVYQPGSSITRTSAITLHAVWKSAYTAPMIIGEAKMYRVSDSASGRNPEVYNEGTRAYIEFTTDKGNNVSNFLSSYAMEVNGTTTSLTKSLSVVTTDASVNTYWGYLGTSGNFNKDLSYDIKVIVTLADVNSETHTITAGSFLSAEVYEIDISTDGKRVAFGHLASDGDGTRDFGVEVYGLLKVTDDIIIGTGEGNTLTDYIIEQGSNSATGKLEYYRTWASGRKEVFGYSTITCNSMTTFGSSGLYHLGPNLVILKSGYFTNRDTWQFMVKSTGGSGYATVWSAFAATDVNTFTLRIVGTAANAGSVVINYHIIGS